MYDYSGDHRGFNILVLDSSSLSTISTLNHFDTYDNADNNVEMKNFIENSTVDG